MSASDGVADGAQRLAVLLFGYRRDPAGGDDPLLAASGGATSLMALPSPR